MRLYICPFKDCDHFASSDGYHCGTHGNRLELNKEITPTNPPLASGDSKDSPHQRCNGAYAIPPSPLMLKHGNSYYSCSVCGEPCVEPAYVNSETSSVKSMSTDSTQQQSMDDILTWLRSETMLATEERLSGKLSVMDFVANNTKIVSEAKAAFQKLLDEAVLVARIDERNRVDYEHTSFSKELFKDRVIDVKQWYLETIVDAHDRRIAELKALQEGK